MPMAVLEAMALGRPCLVTTGTNVTDMVREGGGWGCEVNPVSIAEMLKDVCKCRDSLKLRGQQSRQLVKSRFTWHKIAQEFSEEYAKIIK